MKNELTIDFNFDDVNRNIVRLALSIDKAKVLKKLKTELLTISKEVICDYSGRSNNMDSNVKPELNTPPKSVKEIKNTSVTYEYADKEWKKKAINAVIQASADGRKLSVDDILKEIGVSLDLKSKFRIQIGRLMKKSGIKTVKTLKNGTTYTYYCL